MAKKIKQQQAGKKRASLSLRDNKGRFTSNLFKREVLKTVAAKKGFDVSKDEKQKDKKQVDDLIKQAGITQTELNREYKKNIEIFSDMLEKGGLKTTFKNFNQISNDVDNYKGRFAIKRKGELIPVTKAEMKLELSKFKQFLSSNVNASDYSQRALLTFDGKMIVQIPDEKELRKKYKEEIEEADNDERRSSNDFIEDLINEFDDNEDIVIYGS